MHQKKKTGVQVIYKTSKLRCRFEQENRVYIEPDEDLERNFINTVRSFKSLYQNKNNIEVNAVFTIYSKLSKFGMSLFLVVLLLLAWLSLHVFIN